MIKSSPDSPWLTTKEAALYARRSRKFLAKEVKIGRLRAAHIGGKRELMFRREWLDQFLEDLATPVMIGPNRRRA